MLRSALALVVLVTPHVALATMSALLAWLLWDSVAHGLNWLLVPILVVAVGGLAVVLPLRASRRRRPPPGLMLPEREQRRLWAETRQLCRELGTRPPDEIRLVPEVNVWVQEDYSLLYLRPTTRRLFVGVPLLMTLTGVQLRALLVQQLGRYSRRDRPVAGFLYGVRHSLDQLSADLGPRRRIGRALTWYSGPFERLTAPLAQRQRAAADRLSARLVGRDNAASALLELNPLSTAWTYFLTTYADLGIDLGLRPADLFGGFREFLDDPVRRGQLDSLRERELRSGGRPRQPNDPTSRAFALLRLTDPGPPDQSGPALAVLDWPDDVLRDVQDLVWPGLKAVDWDELAETAGAATVFHNARQLLTGAHRDGISTVTLDVLLTDLRSGRASELVSHLLRSSPARTREITVQLLGDLMAALAVGTGRARFCPHWGGRLQLVDDDTGEPVDPWGMVAAAWGSVEDSRSLRAWLEQLGLDLRQEVVVPERPGPRASGPRPAPAARVAPGVLSALGPVSGGLVRFVVVRSEGLLLVDEAAARMAASAGGFSDRGPTLSDLLSLPVDLLAADRGSELVAWPAISTVRLIRDGGLAPVLAVILNNGDSRILTLAADGQILGDVDRVLSRYLQDRYVRG